MVKTFVKSRQKKKVNVVSEAVKKQISTCCEDHKGPDLRRHYKLNQVPAWVEDREDECYGHTKRVIETAIAEREKQTLYKLSRDANKKKVIEEAGIN